jgi:hypothetical protein
VGVSVALGAWAGSAHAYCRTSTCPLPPDFSPSAAACEPAGFAQYCAALDPPVVPLPVWWRNACQSYDIQENASKHVPLDVATNKFATAFSQWTGASCPGGGHPSIDATNLGPVACDEVHYNTDQGNQHVIIFRDGAWPHPNDLNNTLGLTTITFDPDTGEIYDADMEINSSVPLAVSDPIPADGTDLLSIITHETGHFFGMAHSGDSTATMYAHYIPGSTAMRTLKPDDVSGICAIYPPSGDRSVDPIVADGGIVHADTCDPTPRHGFQSACSSPGGGGSGGNSVGCDVALAGQSGGGAGSTPASVLALAVAGALAGRRRRFLAPGTWLGSRLGTRRAGDADRAGGSP